MRNNGIRIFPMGRVAFGKRAREAVLEDTGRGPLTTAQELGALLDIILEAGAAQAGA